MDIALRGALAAGPNAMDSSGAYTYRTVGLTV